VAVSQVELQRRLSKLEADVRDLILHYQEPNEFLAEFNGHAEFILNSASTADYEWAHGEIDRILRKFGFSARVKVLPPVTNCESRSVPVHG
jgi:hypothetical protein